MKKQTGRKIFCMLLVMLALLIPQKAFAAAKTYVYYGNKLTGMQKTIYTKTLKKAQKGLGKTVFNVSPGTKYRKDLSELIANDNPRIFWIDGYTVTTSASYSPEEGYVYKLTFEPVETWKGAAKKQSLFNKKVNAAVKTVKKKCRGKTKAQQARIAMEYIAANCDYGTSAYDQTAYGVFVKKKALCAGYAKAYKLLCDELGIPCICVSCMADGESHMMNYVKIGKKWYLVDPTWSDQSFGVIYDYFLLGSKTSGCKITRCCGIKIPALAVNDIKKYK